MTENIEIICADCGGQFTWSADEQAFFLEHNLQHRPRRCKACRARRRHARAVPPFDAEAPGSYPEYRDARRVR